MAAPRKKRDVEEMEIQSSDEEFDEEDFEETSGSDEEDSNMPAMVEVDFEAMPPCDGDYDGIQALLKQLFLKSNVNISQLAETIISQNYVGCVIKQCEVPEEEDSDEEAEEAAVFGIMSVLNMCERKDLECVKQIKALILMECAENASDKLAEFKQLFDDGVGKQVGFLLHERFINIPPTIAVPMYESLKQDLESDQVQKMKYKFDQYVFICKTVRPQQETPKNSHIDMKDVMFLNPEEEFLMEFAKSHFTFSVASMRDSVVDGEWEDELESLRTVIVMDTNKMDSAVARIKAAVSKN